ncbi:MAG: type II toxin-antitoxin system HipA family toxin YjjJ [Planctomycetota bacterium]
MAYDLENLLKALGNSGITDSKAIQAALGASQATVSRLIEAAGSRVVRIGRGRNTRYFRPHHLFTSQALFRIDAAGIAEHLADVCPIMGGGYYVEALGSERWLGGLCGDGLYDGLPYFVDDLRPQGYIGRQIARTMGAPYPQDPRRWSSSQVFAWLIETGADLPGALVFGSKALDAALSSPKVVKPNEYPKLAAQTLSGAVPGSSAGGEQPKFAAYSAKVGQVLVKFSAKKDGQAVCRWRDILIAEHHALTTLRRNDVEAAVSRLFEFEGRTFLEVERFDRVGAKGRNSMISLAAIDAEFVGEGRDWVTSLRALLKKKLVPAEDVQRAVFLQLFGTWIGNADMHLGNMSLQAHKQGFSLLPAYDMTPMLWAPIVGELPTQANLKPPVRDPRFSSEWGSSARMALEFWSTLEKESRLSDDYRSIATESKSLIQMHLG